MHETPHTDDNIRIRVYDAAEAPSPAAAEDAEPLREYRLHNTTRAAYHEAVVGNLAGSSSDLTVDKLALGDSTSATGTLAKTAVLGNETFRTTVTDGFADGQDFVASTFISSSQGNGQTYEEAALVAETGSGDTPVNRFLIDDPGGLLAPKTSDETVTFDVTITQQDG